MQNAIDQRRLTCPLNGEICVSGVRKDFKEDQETGQKISCRFWTHLAGKDPQSEKQIDQWDCSISWLPVLMIENAQMTKQVATGVDKTTNVFASGVSTAI